MRKQNKKRNDGNVGQQNQKLFALFLQKCAQCACDVRIYSSTNYHCRANVDLLHINYSNF